MAPPRQTIVIKLGTSSIVHETTHQPLLSTLSAIVETVVHLRTLGHKVVLVSSGAIGVGLKRMEMPTKPKSLSGKQALAAIGQGRLIALWDNLFGQLGQPIAQVLLTRGDISDRTRYLNAVNTFKELLSLGVVPIVNENDTVSVSEIKFGDNDTLSAITSSMLHADYLFLLTDVDSLYTSNPRKDPDAKAIDVVTSIAAIRSQVSTTTLGSNLGTGGMETKLIAAEIATAAGVTTVITSSKDPRKILKIIEYNTSLKSGTATPLEIASGRSSPVPSPIPTSLSSSLAPSGSSSDSLASSVMSNRTVIPSVMTPASRPPHTLFTPSLNPMRDLKAWTTHTLYPSGSVIIDEGAHAVLSRRESGGRLLAAGVVGVRGTFASGQAVRILVRRSKVPPAPSSTTEEDGEVPTAPNTPFILPIGSISSSISTLDGLHDPVVPLTPPISTQEQVTPSVTVKALPEDEQIIAPPSSSTYDIAVDEDLEEVGRGLANYNWAQIDKVKGQKSSSLAQELGYADSEYVVENITIRVPP
ncbi:hypothetical protein QCA50_007588 [Cerrena zonata]|uniref:Aspartate/glutamate/uridylate kinase domain-containing protein n=1 Tax=Cerrena zonata TaxID=2478898 RepID=A0AAW0G8Z0_9APHY